MQQNKNNWRLVFALVALGQGAVLSAAEVEPASKPRVVILCPECGMVYNIRRIEKPVAPERNLLPNLAQGTNNETRAVPLFSIGAGGPQRVQREPATRSTWETTVRYDNGQFGFVIHEMEPDFKVGDRVRHVENTLEVLPQAAR
ncbi:MAG: hypothetical protein JWN94_4759 [Betaproteobacteria bacterium]|nr:hypothetical protein [Betaproteobacteria bacterium]